MDITEIAGIIREDYKTLCSTEKDRFDVLDSHFHDLKKMFGDVLLGVTVCWVSDAFVIADYNSEHCGEDMLMDV